MKTTKNKFKVGDRVRLLSKSVGIGNTGFTGFDCTHQGQVAYVVRINGDGSGEDKENCLVVHGDHARVKTGIGGDFFAPSDLQLIKAEQNKPTLNQWKSSTKKKST